MRSIVLSLAALALATTFVSESFAQSKSSAKLPKKAASAEKSKADRSPAETEGSAVVRATPLAAAPAATTTGTADKRSVKERLAGRLRLGLGISMVNSLNGANLNQGGQTIASVEMSSSTSPALDIKWAQSLYEGPGATKFNWYSSLTIERERTVSNLNAKILVGPNKGQTVPINLATNERPTYQTNLVSAGIEWKPTSIIYVPIGATYPLLTRSTIANGSFNLDPKVGFQAGVGARLNKNFELELLYRRVSYGMALKEKGATTNLVDGTVDSSGGNFSARYIF